MYLKEQDTLNIVSKENKQNQSQHKQSRNEAICISYRSVHINTIISNKAAENKLIYYLKEKYMKTNA